MFHLAIERPGNLSLDTVQKHKCLWSSIMSGEAETPGWTDRIKYCLFRLPSHELARYQKFKGECETLTDDMQGKSKPIIKSEVLSFRGLLF